MAKRIRRQTCQVFTVLAERSQRQWGIRRGGKKRQGEAPVFAAIDPFGPDRADEHSDPIANGRSKSLDLDRRDLCRLFARCDAVDRH